MNPGFPFYTYSVAFLLVGFIVLILGAVMIGGHTTPLSISMSTLQSNIPDQQSLGSDWMGYCDASDDSYGFGCIFYLVYPSQGVFSRIRIEVVEDRIHRLVYTVKDDAIRIGDLVILWGEPRVIEDQRAVNLYWSNIEIRAHVTRQKGSTFYFLPVSQIVVSDVALLANS